MPPPQVVLAMVMARRRVVVVRLSLSFVLCLLAWEMKRGVCCSCVRGQQAADVQCSLATDGAAARYGADSTVAAAAGRGAFCGFICGARSHGRHRETHDNVTMSCAGYGGVIAGHGA